MAESIKGRLIKEVMRRIGLLNIPDIPQDRIVRNVIASITNEDPNGKRPWVSVGGSEVPVPDNQDGATCCLNSSITIWAAIVFPNTRTQTENMEWLDSAVESILSELNRSDIRPLGVPECYAMSCTPQKYGGNSFWGEGSMVSSFAVQCKFRSEVVRR